MLPSDAIALAVSGELPPTVLRKMRSAWREREKVSNQILADVGKRGVRHMGEMVLRSASEACVAAVSSEPRRSYAEPSDMCAFGGV
tara:strand:- start:1 stop:258 length:258 start_codon:yes stop_codon:yes gene_type:complete